MKIEGYCPKYGSPIFSVAWCEVDGKDIILVAAGGGATNSGVLNSVVRRSCLLFVIAKHDLYIYFQTAFSPGADASGKPAMTKLFELDTFSSLASCINISKDVSAAVVCYSPYSSSWIYRTSSFAAQWSRQ